MIPSVTIKDIEDVFGGDFKKSTIDYIKPEILEDFYTELTRHTYQQRSDYDKTIKDLFRKYKMIVSKATLVHYYRMMLNQNKIIFNPSLEVFMRKRVARSASGVVVVTVFTGPSKFSCPMDCHFCPQERDEEGNMTQPRSYSTGEPGAARGAFNDFHPIRQTLDRIASLVMEGHIEPVPESPSKLEFIVSGGTFNFYPKDYLMEFMTSLYYACNCYYEFQLFFTTLKEDPTVSINAFVRPMQSIEEEKKHNETSSHRVIGLTIETRPDWITKKGGHWSNNINLDEIKLFRLYGVTRIQIGIQHTNDLVLKKNNRKCTDEENQWGIFILKQNGFKVDIHIMLDMPGSSAEMDRKMIRQIVYNPNYQADQWKLYPTLVLKSTKIKEWYDAGEYKPYAEMNKGEDLIGNMIYAHAISPLYVRDNRDQRDFPAHEILGGNKITHIGDVIKTRMNKLNLRDMNIRNREVKYQDYNPNDIKFYIYTYRASYGIEYFLSYASSNPSQNPLYGYIRLRFNNTNYGVLPVLHDTALIRELHVLGMQTSINNLHINNNSTQHKNLGTKLVRHAEMISWLYGYDKISIISGEGVRNYYKKKGYNLIETYMIKYLNWINTIKILCYFVYDCLCDFNVIMEYIKLLIKFF